MYQLLALKRQMSKLVVYLLVKIKLYEAYLTPAEWHPNLRQRDHDNYIN
jgi:hypothetical protein